MAVKTGKNLNDLMKQTFEDCTGEAWTETAWYSTDHRKFIERAFFGSDVNLTSTSRIVTEDDPNQGPGIRAVGFTTQALAELEVYLKDLEADPELKKELNKLEPMFQIDLIRNTIIKYILDLRVRCRNVIQTQLDNNYTEYLNYLETTYTPWASEAGWELLFPQGISTAIKKIKNKIAEIKSSVVSGVKTAYDVTLKLQELSGNAITSTTFAFLYKGARDVLGPLPVLLGPCPLKHVNEIEVARSGKKLKFRATGSVFLASQEGGDQSDAIRIEGVLYKSEFGLMFLLWFLFLYGQSKFREIDSLSLIEFETGTNILSEIRKMNDLLMTDSSLEKPSYEFHQTFPFVNRHFIIPNCYIETISIENKLPVKDVLYYSILLRTYTKPKQIVRYVVDEKQGTTLYGFKKKTVSAELCELSLNAGWRWLNASGWLIDKNEWKIGSANKQGALDTYYDIDWASLGTMTYLSLMGEVG